jgi:hypothetical protein
MNEVLKQALDALETELSIDWGNQDEFNASAEKMYKAIAVIKQALAQPEQECPNLPNCNGACFQCEYFNVETGEREYPVAPPEQAPTDELHSCPYAEEIHGNYEKVCDCDEERARQCAQDI